MYNHPRARVYEQRPEREDLLVDEGEAGSAYRIVGVMICVIIGIRIGSLDTLHTENEREVGSVVLRFREGMYVTVQSFAHV